MLNLVFSVPDLMGMLLGTETLNFSPSILTEMIPLPANLMLLISLYLSHLKHNCSTVLHIFLPTH